MLKNLFRLGVPIAAVLLLAGCLPDERNTSAARETAAVENQQAQYEIGQPVPVFDWSLERELVIKLYHKRNEKTSTYSVWRSDYGMIEGDCPSMGYGIPFDTSLTNPWRAIWNDHVGSSSVRDGFAGVAVGQPEPNGIYSSTNTAATWVMCLTPTGALAPVYVETKVTVYPGPVDIDYEKDRVIPTGVYNSVIDFAGAPTEDGPSAN